MLADIVFVRHRWGQEGLEQVLAAMPEEFAEVYRSKLLASTWYTMEFRMALLYAIDKVFARGDMDLFFEMGCHQAEHNLSNYYRAFMKLAGPARTAKAGQLLWGLIYKTSKIAITVQRDRAEVMSFDYPKTAKLNCHVIRGYCHRSFQFTGAVAEDIVSWESSCINDGDANCNFVFKWA
jgi:hypothetical protein